MFDSAYLVSIQNNLTVLVVLYFFGYQNILQERVADTIGTC